MSERLNPPSARTFRRDRLAWYSLFVLIVVSGGSGYWGLHRTVIPPPDPARADSTNPRILILAYDRINDRGTEGQVTPEVLHGQLEALRQEGFEPITLQELVAFYSQARALPSKPILLTFDFGYLDTYDAVDPILRAMAWRAVMFLVTNRQERRDSAYLYWDRVQRMVDSGVWEIGAQGHVSHDPIPIDQHGTLGSFLVERMWLDAAGRRETVDEFTSRVRTDYEASRLAIESNLRNYRVLACASRIGFLGATPHNVFEINREAMASLFSLGFVEDRFGVNDRLSDPHRLKRLRVNPRWSASTLTHRIRETLKDPPLASARHSDEPAPWVADVGEVRLERGELVMSGAPRTDLWLPGSQWPQDWVLEADLWTEGADIWIVQESDTPGEEWRWGGHDGRTYLQRRRWSHVTETVATFPIGITPGSWHSLKLMRRGAGVWIEWDNRPLTERPVYLPAMRQGHVGVVGWRTDGIAKIRIAHLRFSRYPFEIRSVSQSPSQQEVQALIHDAPTIAAVSPVGGIVTGHDVHDVRFDRNLLAILSHRYGWELIPTVRVLPDDGAEPARMPGVSGVTSVGWPSDILTRVEREGWGGLHLDLTRLVPSDRQVIEPTVDLIERRLGARGRRLVVTTDAVSTRPSTGSYARR